MPVTPKNPAFEAEVRSSFQRQKFMMTLGAELILVTPGAVEISLHSSERLHQQSGLAHAGALAAIADSACGYAAMTLMPAGSDVVSIEFKLNLLAPAVGDRLVARAEVLRAGGTISVCKADVFAGETLVATMLATMMRRRNEGLSLVVE